MSVSVPRLFGVVVVAGASLAMGVGVPASAASGSDLKVSMKDFAFMPATVTVKAGTTVTWTYDESPTDPMGCEGPEFQAGIPNATCPGHSTTSVDNGANGKPLWDSGVHRASGFPFSFTFSKPGTYRYYCTVHGGPHPNNPLTHMDGTVVVEVASSVAASSAAQEGTGAGGGATTGSVANASTRGTLPNTGAAPPPLLAVSLMVAGAALAALVRRVPLS